ncbi:MAG TPA: ubiquinol-cytochrome c reductase iron-sulfur subunit [Pedomonas sp.]|nr:ubiquinol-cytochrome c reductase iron-sulfur subunit [Pedomonas sp.]
MATAETPAAAQPGTTEEGVRRRDFIHIATGAFVAGGGAMAAWPFISQMNPAADTRALSTVEVDLAPIAVGQAIKVMWQGKPVFIRNRPEEEVAKERAVSLSDLRDPETDQQRVKEGHDNWLVTLGVCTHLGCVPLGAAQGEPKGEYGGYFCPCHGSHYDASGRIRKGPAPKNLEVPQYAFKTPTSIVIG